MKTRIYSPDIECDSCIKIISKALDKTKGVDSFTITQQYVDVTHKQSVTKKHLLTLIRQKGYRAWLRPKDRQGIRERLKEFLTDKKKYAINGACSNTSA